MIHENKKFKIIGKIISRLGGTLFVAGFLYLIYLVVGFTVDPMSPVTSSGQVVPWSNHGTIHYITVEEHNRLAQLIIFCVAMFLCVAVGIYLERFKNK